MTPNINLLPKREVKKSVINRKYALVIASIAIFFAIFCWQYMSKRSEMAQLTDKETDLLIQQSELLSQIEIMKGQQQSSLEKAVVFVEKIAYDVTPLIDEVQLLQSDTMYLRSYEFGSSSIALKIDFEMLNDVAAFVTALNNSPYFNDVQVGTIQQFNLENQDSTSVENLPRYSVELTLAIDNNYVAAGGKSYE